MTHNCQISLFNSILGLNQDIFKSENKNGYKFRRVKSLQWLNHLVLHIFPFFYAYLGFLVTFLKYALIIFLIKNKCLILTQLFINKSTNVEPKSIFCYFILSTSQKCFAELLVQNFPQSDKNINQQFNRFEPIHFKNGKF